MQQNKFYEQNNRTDLIKNQEWNFYLTARELIINELDDYIVEKDNFCELERNLTDFSYLLTKFLFY